MANITRHPQLPHHFLSLNCLKMHCKDTNIEYSFVFIILGPYLERHYYVMTCFFRGEGVIAHFRAFLLFYCPIPIYLMLASKQHCKKSLKRYCLCAGLAFRKCVAFYSPHENKGEFWHKYWNTDTMWHSNHLILLFSQTENITTMAEFTSRFLCYVVLYFLIQRSSHILHSYMDKIGQWTTVINALQYNELCFIFWYKFQPRYFSYGHFNSWEFINITLKRYSFTNCIRCILDHLLLLPLSNGFNFIHWKFPFSITGHLTYHLWFEAWRCRPFHLFFHRSHHYYQMRPPA